MNGAVISNIVPVQPNLVEEEQPATEIESQAEIAGTDPPEMSYSEKLAKDAITFLNEEFKDNLDREFWEILKAECCKRLGEAAPLTSTIPLMTPEQAKLFADEEIPWGRYAGRRVGTIAKRDRAALERLATQALPFQTRLQRFLVTESFKSGK